MLHCIWHPLNGQAVVQTDEFNQRLASGKWFRTRGEANLAKLNGDTTHGQQTNQQRHDLQRPIIEAGDDRRETVGVIGSDENGRRDGEHGNSRARIRKKSHQRIGSRIPSEVKGDSDNGSSRANHQ